MTFWDLNSISGRSTLLSTAVDVYYICDPFCRTFSLITPRSWMERGLSVLRSDYISCIGPVDSCSMFSYDNSAMVSARFSLLLIAVTVHLTPVSFAWSEYGSSGSGSSSPDSSFGSLSSSRQEIGSGSSSLDSFYASSSYSSPTDNTRIGQGIDIPVFTDQCFEESCNQTDKAKTCQCDNLCLSLGDCCEDYDPNVTVAGVNTTFTDANVWKCVNDSFLPIWYPELRHGYRMVARCPSTWPFDDIRRGCENASYNHSELLHVSDEKYFLNAHCAFCNGVNDSAIRPILGNSNCSWLADTQLECSDPIPNDVPSNDSFINITAIIYELPLPRFCLIGVEERCMNESANMNDRQSCLRNYAPFVLSNGRVIKNPSCFQCNDEKIVLCAENIQMRDIIYDIPLSDEVEIGITAIFFQMSRLVSPIRSVPYCVEGTELDEYLRCVPVSARWESCNSTDIHAEQTHGQARCLQDVFCSRSVDDSLTIESTLPCFELTTHDNESIYFSLRHDGIIPHFTATEEVVTGLMYDGRNNSCLTAEVYLSQKCFLTDEEANGTTCDFEMFVDSPNEFRPCIVRNESLVFYNQSYIEPLWWHNQTFLVMDGDTPKSNHIFHLCGVQRIVQTCPFVVVMNDTIEWIPQDNGSILDYRNRLYDSNEFMMNPDGSVSICYVYEAADYSVQTILGHVVFAVSSACLLATLVTYSCFPGLRNRQGIVIMNFLVALFMGQILLQYVGYQVSRRLWLCVIVAAFSHFFFVSSFVWTTVLAWDLSRSFSASKMTVSASRSCGRKMVFYLIVGWGIPFLLVMVTLLLQFAPLQEVPLLEYGGPSCWFTSRLASLAVFFVPISICLLANMALFGITIHGVHSTKQSTTVLRNDQGLARKERLQELTIYIKISSLLGFGWLSGFLAMVINVSAMWYVFIVASGLQGLFIFVSLGANRRTRKLWRKSLEGSSVWSSIVRKSQTEVRSNSKSIDVGRKTGSTNL